MPLGLDGHWQWEDEHALLRECHAEGEEDAIDGSRCSDGGERVEGHAVGSCKMEHIVERGSLIGNHRVNLHCLRQFLTQSGTDAADEVIDDEAPLPEGALYQTAKHPQGKHIKEQVHPSGMHEHVCEQLPDVEVLRLEIVQSEDIGEVDAPHSQHAVGKEAEDVDNKEILCNRGYLAHT